MASKRRGRAIFSVDTDVMEINGKARVEVIVFWHDENARHGNWQRMYGASTGSSPEHKARRLRRGQLMQWLLLEKEGER